MMFLNRTWNALGQEKHEEKVGDAQKIQRIKRLRKDALRIKEVSFLSSASI